MTTSKINQRKWIKDHQFVKDLTWLIALICGSLVIIGILVGTNVLPGEDNGPSYGWLTGFVIGAFFSTIALWIIRISTKTLAKTQNHFLYVFLFFARLGLYFIPFLIAVLIPGYVINVYGVIWGVILPPAVIPLSGIITALRSTFSKKEVALSRAAIEKNN